MSAVLRLHQPSVPRLLMMTTVLSVTFLGCSNLFQHRQLTIAASATHKQGPQSACSKNSCLNAHAKLVVRLLQTRFPTLHRQDSQYRHVLLDRSRHPVEVTGSLEPSIQAHQTSSVARLGERHKPRLANAPLLAARSDAPATNQM